MNACRSSISGSVRPSGRSSFASRFTLPADPSIRVVVVVQDFAKRVKHTVVHIRRRYCVVAQARHLEHAFVAGPLSHGSAAAVAELTGHRSKSSDALTFRFRSDTGMRRGDDEPRLCRIDFDLLSQATDELLEHALLAVRLGAPTAA